MSVCCLQAGSTDTTFLRSGNPGYIVGEPVVAGTLTTLDDKYPFKHFLMNWAGLFESRLTLTQG